MPLNDPIGTAVLGSDARDISAVRRGVHASREYVLNTPAA